MGKSCVRVVARTRPTDKFANDSIQVQDDNKTVNIHTTRRSGIDVINNALENHAFKLDLILRDASQEMVFDTCAIDIVKSVISGYNGTVMCYGQTGAGKTYTMMGGSDYRTRGIIPRCVKAVFDEASSQADKSFEIKVSYMEVYNEALRDLLDPQSKEDFAIQEDAKGNIVVRGVQQKVCGQEAEALTHLFEGNCNRVVAEHVLNSASSRSHCIFTVHVTSRSRVESDSASMCSKLHLIDLAGSERLSKTTSEGTTMMEARYINKSLTFLEQVVMALGTTSRAHVPFRQSKLTNLLKDSLGGNSKTTMIANLWPEERHMEETVSTLKFAVRMMKVQTEATVNMVMDPATQIKQLQKQITELKAELQMQNQLMGKSHITYEGEIGEDERFEMEKTVRAYIEGGSQEIQVRSLREVKEYFRVFKAFVDSKDAELKAALVAAPSAESHVPAPAAADDKKGATQKKRISVEGTGNVDGTTGVSVGVAAPAKSLKDVMKPPPVSPQRQKEQQEASSPDAGGASPQKAGEETVPREKPDKNASFAEYKETEGAKLVQLLKETQSELNIKRKRAAELSATVNQLKLDIDAASFQLEQRRLDRQARGEDETVDDEEFEIVRVAKIRKQEYRKHYDELTSVKAERDHLHKTLQQAKTKLLNDFEQWYDASFANTNMSRSGGLGSLKAVQGIAGRTAGIDDDDTLDEGEKFEMLELNRVISEDPESVAYHSAKKHTQSKPTIRRNNAIGRGGR